MATCRRADEDRAVGPPEESTLDGPRLAGRAPDGRQATGHTGTNK
jgi:hypothetical protein